MKKNYKHPSRSKNTTNLEVKTERVQKLLAMSGVGSRREIENLIEQGRVKVNSQICQLGDKASLTDKILLDGKRVRLKIMKRTKIILANKPSGYLCSTVSEEGKPTVYDLFKLPKNERWLMVGRLDFNTSGLLIFTNDGDLANRLMHPSFEQIRSYALRVHPKMTEEQLNLLKAGIELEDGIAKFSSIHEIKNQDEDSFNQWYQVQLAEGRNREIRRMCEALELTVSRLIRTGFGPFELPRNLRRGKWLFLEENQLARCVKLINEKPVGSLNNPES